jgi:hypothetical protein
LNTISRLNKAPLGRHCPPRGVASRLRDHRFDNRSAQFGHDVKVKYLHGL